MTRKPTIADYRQDALYPRIAHAVEDLLRRGTVVTPVEVLVEMGLLTGEHLQDWRRGRVPYLERVIHCNLARKANVGGPSPSAPTDPNLKAAAPARRHSASLRDIIANFSDGVTRDGMTNRAGGRYSWRRRYPREAPAMSRFRGCLTVLAAALWGAGAAVSVAEPRAGSPADGTLTAIVGATVVHPELEGAAASSSDSTVIIAGNRIRAVGPAATTSVPRGTRVIDGHGRWVIPGLIDSHVHFFQSGNLYTRPDAADFGAWRPYAAEVQRNQARLPQTFRVWLASGVTSVADVGGPFWNFQVRDAARNSAAAPRVAVTGPLISMVEDPKLDLGDPPIVRINSGEEARQLVARELEHKPDYIKVWFIHRAGDDLAAQEAIVRATAEAAHAAGLRLAVHATELLVAKSALHAGADYLVHSVEDEPVDEEFLALARERHILYCPTLFVRMGYFYALSGTWQATEAERRLADPQVLAGLRLDEVPRDKLPERVAKLVSEHREVAAPTVAMQNLLKVWNAGITVVMGTDAGNIGTLHGPAVFREMELMQRAGLTPLQVLRSATVNGAATMALSDLGSVAAGKLADLVVLDADPLVDVANLSHASFVFRNGHEFTPAELMSSLH